LISFGVRDGDRKQRAFELCFPKSEEKIFNAGKSGNIIVVLPDVSLQQPAPIRTAINEFPLLSVRSLRPAFEILGNRIFLDHANLQPN
jgi:hypothetical protein